MNDHRRVLAALDAVPRKDFLPDDIRPQAGSDQPLAIGHGATCSQPWTVQFMLELLHVAPGSKVLDIGSGSGWTTALLAELTGAHGAVVGTEIVPELVTFGRKNLPDRFRWAHIEQADPHTLGVPLGEPFDRILVSADVGEIPPVLEEQLAVGGRMVLPASGVLWVIDREHEGLHRGPITGYRFSFVPLVLSPTHQTSQ